MSKWKCEICGLKFENFHAQGFNHKIYCPLCYYKQLYEINTKEIERLNNIINELEKDSIAFRKLNAWIVNRHAPDLFHKMEIVDKLKELKDSD